MGGEEGRGDRGGDREGPGRGEGGGGGGGEGGREHVTACVRGQTLFVNWMPKQWFCCWLHKSEQSPPSRTTLAH